ncbi:unnamed protein product [Rhizoctonia solani]|uniref:Complex 1 LYR protein domain-containing protein n=1 Tax=Rhizoctonia solani TaxID=456999 RepID=A0A8H2WWF9_9AGAM|nr:unnamed protein product [Rhizoctonia solani]
MSAPSRAQILSLYGAMIRTSRSFSSYNFRNYFLRRTRTQFHEHLNEKDPAQIRTFYDTGLRELEVLKRCAIVNRLYEGPRLVVERKPIVAGGGAGVEASVGGGGQPV